MPIGSSTRRNLVLKRPTAVWPQMRLILRVLENFTKTTATGWAHKF